MLQKDSNRISGTFQLNPKLKE